MKTPVQAMMLVLACSLPGHAGLSQPQDCRTSWVVTVTPASATLDHTASPARNTVQFIGTAVETAPKGCPVPALARREYASWANPEPTRIEISSARDGANGTASCLAATKGPVTLTGTFNPIGASAAASQTSTKTVTLTCN